MSKVAVYVKGREAVVVFGDEVWRKLMQAPADLHRGEVQAQHNGNKQQRRHVDHHFRGFDIGRLESDIIDVETQVHEFAIQMQVRWNRING